MFRPSQYQPDLPLERLIVREAPSDDATPLDVLFVGAGPAGLAGAIRLAELLKQDPPGGEELQIGVLEKAGSLGEHNLSGAVIDPRSLRSLFPGLPDSEFPFASRVAHEEVYWLTSASASRRIPTPSEMRNAGHYTASICELVRWLGERAEAAGVHLFTGFPADGLLVAGDRVVGVRTVASGLGRDAKPGSGYMPPGDITARVTVIADGTRSSLAQAWQRWQEIRAPNPQLYALGVKELWEVPKAPESVIHTLGWPLPRDAFGGSWIYPMGPQLVSLGLVVGLDYRDARLDVHELTQRFKTHPLVRSILDGGELVEWGAKTIPEGGFHALPERLHGDGILVAGDAAGLVNVAALKGIHYAVQSGIFAAEAIHAALKAGDVGRSALARYDALLRDSFVWDDLRRTRNMRLAFKSGFFVGGAKAWLMSLTNGAFPGGRIAVEPDAEEERETTGSDGSAQAPGLSKVDAVFRSGNATRDDIPSHLVAPEKVPGEVAEFYSHLCPAGVYERRGDGLAVNAPNCVDCKATDVLGPRWTPREGGSGPRYKRM